MKADVCTGLTVPWRVLTAETVPEETEHGLAQTVHQGLWRSESPAGLWDSAGLFCHLVPDVLHLLWQLLLEHLGTGTCGL